MDDETSSSPPSNISKMRFRLNRKMNMDIQLFIMSSRLNFPWIYILSQNKYWLSGFIIFLIRWKRHLFSMISRPFYIEYRISCLKRSTQFYCLNGRLEIGPLGKADGLSLFLYKWWMETGFMMNKLLIFYWLHASLILCKIVFNCIVNESN